MVSFSASFCFFLLLGILSIRELIIGHYEFLENLIDLGVLARLLREVWLLRTGKILYIVTVDRSNILLWFS